MADFQMSGGDAPGIIVGIMLALWAVRELVPVVLRLQGRRHDSRRPPPPAPAPTPAESSGSWQAQQRPEVEQRLGHLEVVVARIDERVGILFRRAFGGEETRDRSGPPR